MRQEWIEKPLPDAHFSGSPLRASSIIGAVVVNEANETLGDIEDVVIDSRTGKVAYAVLWCGAFVGMAEKLMAIPFSILDFNAAKKAYVLNVSSDRLKAAPGFDSEHWPLLSDENWIRDVFEYYERMPYWI
jgi:hypothetical protein